jgi:hypothetical protein
LGARVIGEEVGVGIGSERWKVEKTVACPLVNVIVVVVLACSMSIWQSPLMNAVRRTLPAASLATHEM